MREIIFIVFVSFICSSTAAQKNLIPAQRTNLLGLPIPAGSKQDKRLLPVSAAKTFIQMETPNAGIKILTTEVYVLPSDKTFPYSMDSLVQGLLRGGFRPTMFVGNEKFRWVEMSNRLFLVYFSREKNSADLYVAQVEKTNTDAVSGSGTKTGVSESDPGKTTNQANVQVVDQKLIGKWNRSGASHPHYADPASWGTSGYTTSRYEFSADGSYIYTERSFWMLYEFIVIVKESGRYVVNGNSLTIEPQKSVIQSYTKRNNVDELGTLAHSQNRSLEKVTYTYRFHFFTGIQEWNLVLQASSSTRRDGAFSGNTTFSNAWYFDQKYINNDLTSPKGK